VFDILNKKNLKKLKKNNGVQKFAMYVILILTGFLAGVNLTLIRKINPSFLYFTLSVSASDEISAKELNDIISDEDLVLINVHTPYEGEIPYTDSFIEYDAMMANKESLPVDKNTPIVLYCMSGRMSSEALKTLKNMGYTNVRHLDGGMKAWKKSGHDLLELSSLPDKVLPEKGFDLPIKWGDVGPKLVQAGIIDLEKFDKVMQLSDKEKEILTKGSDGNITIGAASSRFVVNMLWALGLAQKSKVYDEGPMGTEYKDRAGNFASTGGWSLAKGNAMNYYNKFEFIPLTQDEHDKVMALAGNVYRPCCGNHTAFPDCNHGMAALAAIEMMVAEGISDEEIYASLLKLNSFWFPQNYLATATLFARQGIDWSDIDAKEILGADYSSAQSAGEVFKSVGALPYEIKSGGSCGA
jgi:rhodanese-related sulfurtransferase